MERTPEEQRRRRIGLGLIAAVCVLFVVQMIALAMGAFEVSGLIFLIFVAGWFALRSYQRRSGGAS